MTIQATCPECRYVFRLSDTSRGKKVRCSHCKTVFTAGAPAAKRYNSSAITPTVAKTKAAEFSADPKEASWVVAADHEGRQLQENNNSILLYLLMGGGVLILLCGGVTSIGGYFAWKAMASLEEQNEVFQTAEEQNRLDEDAHRRFQAEVERAQAEFEKAQAEHNRHMEEAQRRITERLKEAERRRLEKQRQVEADIEQHRKVIRDQLGKIGPDLLPGGIGNPLAPPPQREVVQAVCLSIPLHAKTHEVFGIFWTGSDSKKAVVVNMAGSVMQLDHYDLTNGRKISSMDTPLQSVTASIRDVSPDGNYYVCNDARKFFSIWAMPDPKPIVEKWQSAPIPHQGVKLANNYVAAAYLLSGERLLTANAAGQVGVWSIAKDAEDKPSLQRSYVPAEALARYPTALVDRGIAISPDRTRLAIFNGSDGFLILDTATLQLQGVVKSPEDALAASDPMRGIYGVAFSPDGKQLAAILHSQSFRPGAQPSYPQLVRWDVRTQQRTARFDDLSKGSGGPGARVGWWGNDHIWVASATHPGSLVSWAKQRVVLRASLRIDEKIYFGNTDGKCWFLVANPGGNTVLKGIDLPTELLKHPDQSLQLTRDGILR